MPQKYPPRLGLAIVWLFSILLWGITNATAQSTELSPMDILVRSYDNKADYNLDRNLALAKRQIDTAAALIKAHPTQVRARIKANHFNELGNYHQKLEEFDVALSYQLEAIRIFEEIKDDFRTTIVKVNMANLLFAMKQYTKAEKVALEAIALERKGNYHRQLGKSLSLLSAIYFNTNRGDETMALLDEALIHSKAAEDTETIIYICLNRIQNFQILGSLEKAAPYIDELESLANQFNHQFGKANALHFKGLLANERNQYALANDYYHQSIELFKKEQSVFHQIEVHRDISKNSIAINDYKTAYESAHAVNGLLDTLYTKRQEGKVNELTVKYDTEKKEAQLLQQQSALELASLRAREAEFDIFQRNQQIETQVQDLEKASLREKQAQLEAERDAEHIALQNDQIDSAKQRQRGFIIGLLIVSVLLGLLTWQFLVARRANKALSQSNTRIELMLRELHHRVKNNLQMVSSLFRLQARRMTDVNTATVLREGQARVEAMSILHQQLYQTETVTNINLQTYLDTLLDKLQYAYGFSETPFTANISVEPTEIDVDKALPIGLIVNELLTNSFKYAFKDNPAPHIHLEIRPTYLYYKDNGVGLPASFNPQQIESFGTRLISSFSQQLNGRYKYSNDNGLIFRLDWQL